MATIRAYTTVEQSRKLAEILPLESADMWWSRCTITDFGDGVLKVSYAVEPCNISQFRNTKEDIPCWSLAALLGVLPKEIPHKDAKCIEERRDWSYGWLLTSKCLFYKCTILLENGGRYDDVFAEVYHQDNPVKACYEMVIRLHELNLL